MSSKDLFSSLFKKSEESQFLQKSTDQEEEDKLKTLIEQSQKEYKAQGLADLQAAEELVETEIREAERREAERREHYEPIRGRPLKTITLCITMHGGLKTPSQSVSRDLERIKDKYILINVSSKCGVIVRTSASAKEKEMVIEGYRNVYKRHAPEESQVSIGNRIIANTFERCGLIHRPLYLPGGYRTTSLPGSYGLYNIYEQEPEELQKYHPGYTIEELKQAEETNNELTDTSVNHHMRTHTDLLKFWTPDPKLTLKYVSTYGIFIVCTHHCEEDHILKDLDNFKTNIYNPQTSTEEEEASINLLNRNLGCHEILDHLVKSLLMHRRPVSNSLVSYCGHHGGRGFMCNVRADKLKVRDVELKVLKYIEIPVTRIVNLFLEMGFEMVNIIDQSCQHTSDIEIPGLYGVISGTRQDFPGEGTQGRGLIRHASINSNLQAGEVTRLLESTHTGGRRRKKKQATRKKRNRKTRKGRKQKTHSRK
jgi:hypothetical protein